MDDDGWSLHQVVLQLGMDDDGASLSGAAAGHGMTMEHHQVVLQLGLG